MKIELTENERKYALKLAEAIDFPIEQLMSYDGSFHLKESVIVAKLKGYLGEVSSLPNPFKAKLATKIIEKLAEELPGAFIRKKRPKK